MHCRLQAKGGITSDILEAMTAEHKTLSSRRKKRQISETIATPDEVSSMNLAGSFPIHKTTQVKALYNELQSFTFANLAPAKFYWRPKLSQSQFLHTNLGYPEDIP